MPHLWCEDETGEWTPWPLREAVLALERRPGARHAGHAVPEALLLRSRTIGSERWLLMNVSLHPLFINGEVLRTGIRVLNDRDEIRGSGIDRCFYSEEILPTIEIFAGSDREVFCPRCGLRVDAGTPIIRCGCTIAMHQNAADDLECYVYGPTCPLCGRPTVLTDTYRWLPGEL